MSKRMWIFVVFLAAVLAATIVASQIIDTHTAISSTAAALSQPPTLPSDGNVLGVLMRKCTMRLFGDQNDAYERDFDRLIKDRADAETFGAMMKHYYGSSCSKEQAFTIYWTFIRFGYDSVKQQVITREAGDINAAWGKFVKGWDT